MTASMSDFQLIRPTDVTGAMAARREQENSRYLAGGTDLVVNLRRGLGRPALLIDLSGIEELAQLATSEKGVRIGACVTIRALARDPIIQKSYRALAEAAEAVAGPGHRALATVGGNLCLDTRCIYYNQSEWWRSANQYCLKYGGDICHVAPQGQRCHAAFSGDLAPALIAFGAEAEIASATSHKRIPLSKLYVEDGKAHLALADEELLVAIYLPPGPPPSSYGKVRLRAAIDFPLAGVAVALATEKGRIKTLRIALTGTNPRPFLLAGAEAFSGRSIDEDVLREIDRLIQKQVQPMRTTTASAHYRRLAAAALARRLVMKLSSEAGASS